MKYFWFLIIIINIGIKLIGIIIKVMKVVINEYEIRILKVINKVNEIVIMLFIILIIDCIIF